MSVALSFTSSSVQKSTATGTSSNCQKKRFGIWRHRARNPVELPQCDPAGSFDSAPLRAGLRAVLFGRIQLRHVIAHAVFERKPRLVPKRFSCAGEIGLREVLIMRVRI